MTIKIINPGVLSRERTYAASCLTCGCEFTFQRGDAAMVYDQRDGDYLLIACPTCKLEVSVDANQRVVT